MIEIIGGSLYQWDIGRQVKVTPKQGYDVQKLNFTTQDMTDAKVVEDIIDHDGYITAEIPDEFFQQYKNIICYAIMINSNGEQTVEEKSFSVIKRNRPEDYDINSNKKIKNMLEEILGESGGDTIFDKLEYLKGCVDILKQSPPLKLMREVYEENNTLKELTDYISIHEQQIYSLRKNENLLYEFSKLSQGFSEKKGDYFYPNGKKVEYVNNIYQHPIVYRLVDSSKQINLSADYSLSFINAPSYGNSPVYKDMRLIDLRNIRFMGKNIKDLKELEHTAKYKIIVGHLEGIFLPKCSYLEDNTIKYMSNSTITNFSIPYGIHLGQYIRGCSSDWLFKNDEFDVSTQKETPVYCDKDFYGTIYLEKLNIPLECIVDLLDNLAFIDETMTKRTFSIGDYNLNKLYDYLANSGILDSEELNKLLEDVENGVISQNEYIEKIKNLDRAFGIYCEVNEMKGWNIQ